MDLILKNVQLNVPRMKYDYYWVAHKTDGESLRAPIFNIIQNEWML